MEFFTGPVKTAAAIEPFDRLRADFGTIGTGGGIELVKPCWRRVICLGGSGVSRLPSLQCELSCAEAVVKLVDLGQSDTMASLAEKLTP